MQRSANRILEADMRFYRKLIGTSVRLAIGPMITFLPFKKTKMKFIWRCVPEEGTVRSN